MGLTELFILAVGLSMDAFAVAVCKGLAMPKVTWKKITAVGLWSADFRLLCLQQATFSASGLKTALPL